CASSPPTYFDSGYYTSRGSDYFDFW
nr:immunoglobulin heavy chain junction region [Macaca mulatta]